MDPREVLKKYKLSQTPHRLELLSVLADCERALTEKELEQRMNGICNRTTIYRNLNLLSEKKIVHRILSGDAVKYRLAISGSESYRNADHIHFECRNCNTTYCFENLTIEDFPLPDGFEKQENQFIIFGTCEKCRDSYE